MLIGLSRDVVLHTKMKLRSAMNVDNIVAAQGCIACSPCGPAENTWTTFDGEMMYHSSGCCESCLSKRGQESFSGCSVFTEIGKHIAELWISVHDRNSIEVDSQHMHTLCTYLWPEPPLSPRDVFAAIKMPLRAWQ